jgi:hypothetical protein
MRLPWFLFALAVVFVAFAVGLELASEEELAAAYDYYFSIGALLFPAVGALLASRVPGNPIGWLLLGFGAFGGLTVAAHNYAVYGASSSRDWPAVEAVAWAEAWSADWLSPLLLIFLVLLFPTGRLRPWERKIAWFAVGTGVLGVVSTAFRPGRFDDSPIENPLGWDSPAIGAAETASWILLLAAFVLAASALIVRLRRAKGDERQQLKWFVYAVALLASTLVVGTVAEALTGSGTSRVGDAVGFAVFSIALFAIPVAIAIAILRYRLYDIDLVINRTLVYGSVTALLAGAYFGLVLLLQLAFQPVTEGSGLAVALSTLAVAGLFRPARNRVQILVDRRFYRRRYDAQRTLEGFVSRLRNEVELDALRAELTGVVGETMQPAHVSLWLKETAR